MQKEFLLSPTNKKKSLYTLFILFNALYLISAYFQLGEIRLLPVWEMDKKIPYIPYAIWPYLYIQYLIFKLLVKESDLLLIRRWFIASLIYVSFWFIVYLIFPTSYFSENTFSLFNSSVTTQLLSNYLIYSTSLNCFPAYFIGIAFLLSFLEFSKNKFIGFLYIIGSVVMSFASLMIKQTYTSSIIAAAIIALVLTIVVTISIKE